MKKLLIILGVLFFTLPAYADTVDCPIMKNKGGIDIDRSCQYTETVATTVTGDNVLMSGFRGNPISVTVLPSGTAKVEYTNHPFADVIAGTAGIWADWAAGSVTSTTTATLFGPVTALRIVSVSGSASIVITQF